MSKKKSCLDNPDVVLNRLMDKNDFAIHYAPKILLALKKKKMFKYQVREELKIGKNAFAHWLSGETNPNLMYVLRICKILDIDLKYFLDKSQELTEDEWKLIERKERIY